MNINRIIEKVSKRNLVQPCELTFRLNGGEYNLKLYRHFDGRDVSICNRARCNAGSNCCHYAKVDGVGLCCTLSSYYTLRVAKDLSHLFAQGISREEEEAMIGFTQNVLDVISGTRHLGCKSLA